MVLVFGEDSRALRLTSELVDFRAANANRISRPHHAEGVYIIRNLLRDIISP